MTLLWPLPSPAQTTHQTVNLSFLYPISTNRTPDVSAGFRFSLLYGRLQSIRGVDFNLGASVLEGDFTGVQLSGLYSQVGGDFGGFMVGFGPSYLEGSGEGGQFSVFPNIVRGDFSGLQYSTLFNFDGGSVHGVQLSSIFNLVDGGGGFLQLSGVANAVGADYRGVQIAAGFNYGRERLSGVQLGLANFASEMNGFQLAGINFAGEFHGIQVGALNLVRDNQGVPVGLFNYSEQGGSVDWITYVSNLSLINTGVRTTVNRFYSMLALGGVDLEAEVDETAFLSWNFGYRAPLNHRWSLGGDLGYVHIMPKKSDDPSVNDRLHFALQARVLGELRLSPRVAVFAAGGASLIFSEYASNADSEVKPLVAAGVSLF